MRRSFRRIGVLFAALLVSVSALGMIPAASAQSASPEFVYEGLDPMICLKDFVSEHPFREAGTEDERRAADYLAEVYTAYGFEPFEGGEMITGFTKKQTVSQNVAAVKRASVGGVKRELSDPSTRIVLVSAHYDNASKSMTAGYQGAYDNGTGVATLLALGENIRETEFPFHIVFANFGAEELGLYGSQAFLDGSFFNMKDRVLLAINFDVVGGGKNLYLYTDEVKASHDGYIRSVASGIGVRLTDNPAYKRVTLNPMGKFAYSHVGMMSDNSVFAASDIPIAFFFSYDWGTTTIGITEGDGKNIMHTQDDNTDHLPESAAMHMKMTAGLVEQLFLDKDFVTETEHIERMDYSLLTNGLFAMLMYLAIILGGVAFVLVQYFTKKHKPAPPPPPEDPFENKETFKVFDDFE